MSITNILQSLSDVAKGATFMFDTAAQIGSVMRESEKTKKAAEEAAMARGAARNNRKARQTPQQHESTTETPYQQCKKYIAEKCGDFILPMKQINTENIIPNMINQASSWMTQLKDFILSCVKNICGFIAELIADFVGFAKHMGPAINVMSTMENSLKYAASGNFAEAKKRLFTPNAAHEEAMDGEEAAYMDENGLRV